jgi:hypothetical protein
LIFVKGKLNRRLSLKIDPQRNTPENIKMLGGKKKGIKTAMEIITIVQTYEKLGTIKGTARALSIAKGAMRISV